VAQKTPRHNGFAIRDFRIKAGLSVDELAQRTCISAPHIRNIEHEHREPNPVHLHKIAEVLGVRAASLVRDPSLLSGQAAEAAS
jgi:transcriptional regulator with XRE-family HTH domain